MKTWTITPAGMLSIQSWRFALPDNDPPHRHEIVCACGTIKSSLGRKQEAIITLKSNHKGNTWYLTGSCSGFAGPKSRAINSVATKSRKVFETWREAILGGKVEVI